MSWSSGEGTGLADEGTGLADRVRRQRFSLAMRGYATVEVDRYLEALAGGIERLHQAVLQPAGLGGQLSAAGLPSADSIQRQAFTVALNGYAMIEVDAFLDDIIEAVNHAWTRLQAPPPAPARPAFAAMPAPSAVPLPGGMRELPSLARGERLDAAAVRSVQFPRAFRGYTRKQVDRLLEQAAATLDRLDAAFDHAGALERPARPPGLTAADIERAGFFVALLGYDMTRVDAFLDRVAGALAARDERFGPGPA